MEYSPHLSHTQSPVKRTCTLNMTLIVDPQSQMQHRRFHRYNIASPSKMARFSLL